LEIVPQKRTRWTLTPEAFEYLMARLSADREEAAREFEELRRYLTTLLTYAGGAEPEHLADIALDRAAKRLSEGEQIENLKGWLRGAARRVLLESRADAKRESSAVETAQLEISTVERKKEDLERDHELLAECLGLLVPESRSLIERYYQATGEPLLAARKRLAEQLGISIENLRTRALRLRKIVERCFTERRRKLT
jgi:DNA-directed RNA polymerase specialized sigma24 family protein